MENVVGGRGDAAKTDKVDDEQLLANVDIDETQGGMGDDNLKGGSGDDKIKGGQGDDKIKGGSGDDKLHGGQGDDKLKGGSGDGVLLGGQGDDKLKGGSGDDILAGGTGDDLLKVVRGADLLVGGQGDDSVKGGSGDDILIGGQGDDSLQGGSGADFLHGGKGGDSLKGGSGSDRLHGGKATIKAGDDKLHGHTSSRAVPETTNFTAGKAVGGSGDGDTATEEKRPKTIHLGKTWALHSIVKPTIKPSRTTTVWSQPLAPKDGKSLKVKVRKSSMEICQPTVWIKTQMTKTVITLNWMVTTPPELLSPLKPLRGRLTTRSISSGLGMLTVATTKWRSGGRKQDRYHRQDKMVDSRIQGNSW